MAEKRTLNDSMRRLRGGLASLRAAAETLQAFPEMEAERRRRLLAVVVDEAESLTRELVELERSSQPAGDRSRRRLDAAALLDAARRAAAERGLVCEVEGSVGEKPLAEQPQAEIAVGPFRQAVSAFADALRRDLHVSRSSLALRFEPEHLMLEIAWAPAAETLASLPDWQRQALEAGDSEQGLRAFARAHDGEAWFVLDRDGSSARIRLLLPAAGAAGKGGGDAAEAGNR